MEMSNCSSLEDAELAMSTMLTRLMDSLFVHPEQSSVEFLHRGEATVFVVTANAEDLTQLAEGNLRTARSLQMIVNAIGLKSQRRFSLTFRDSTVRDEESLADGQHAPSPAT